MSWTTLLKVLSEVRATQQLSTDGFDVSRQHLQRSANLHYQGQTFELSVNVPPGEVDLMALVEAFGDEHERTYGHRAGPEEPVELAGVEVVGRGIPSGLACLNDCLAWTKSRVQDKPATRGLVRSRAYVKRLSCLDRI